jgi:hypothetical protein
MRERNLDAAAGRERGFALILALLALTLLTFLGLTLALTTSTEVQIAANYRWGQQALYNAEAGIEMAKGYLKQTPWKEVLPPARNLAGMSSPPAALHTRPGLDGEATRNFENKLCDSIGNAGFGIVLDDPSRWAGPMQNTATFLGQDLNGTFTVWLRRPIVWDENVNGYVDDPGENSIVVTAEGTAPLRGAAAFSIASRAVRVLEYTLDLIDASTCENLGGQVGAGPTGAGFDQCQLITAAGVPTQAGSTTTGPVTEPDATQR